MSGASKFFIAMGFAEWPAGHTGHQVSHPNLLTYCFKSLLKPWAYLFLIVSFMHVTLFQVPQGQLSTFHHS